MFDGVFDIITIRWINFFLIIGAIFLSHMVSRKMNSLYFGIPMLIWLFQALLFYLFFFGYWYDYLYMPIQLAERVFSYWASLSRFLGLITMYIYLYYIYRSGWRGNGA